jgi:hypothetical protein
MHMQPPTVKILVPLLMALAMVARPSFSQRVYAGGGAYRGSAATSVNRNVNVNANRNINVNRNVDVNVNRYGGGYYGGGCCYHPAATAAAVTAATVATAAVVGSIVNTLPPSCSAVVINGLTYQQCGSTWYQPQLAGSTTSYVIVNAPR